MNWYLITLSPARPEMLSQGPTPEEQAAVGAHFEYLQGLYAEGRLTLAGRTLDNGPETLGLAVIRAMDDEEAQSMLAHDPAIRAGVFRGLVRPYGVAIGGWPEIDQN